MTMLAGARGAGVRVSAPEGGDDGTVTGLFVAADADGGDGSAADPWTLAQALATTIPPGTDVWLRGGTYTQTGMWVISKGGASGLPVRFRGYPGELATVTVTADTLTTNDTIKVMGGDHLVVRDLLITREWDGDRLHSTNVDYGNALNIRAVCDAINNLVVDAASGIYSWEAAGTSKVYGNLILNSGWFDPDRGHGHGCYCQCQDPNTRLLKHNIMLQLCGHGPASKTAGGNVENFSIIENIVANTWLSNFQHYSQINPSFGIVIDGNVGLNRVRSSAGTPLGTLTGDSSSSGSDILLHNYGGTPEGGHGDVAITDHFSIVDRMPIGLNTEWEQITMLRNILGIYQDGLQDVFYVEQVAPGTRIYDDNAYYRGKPTSRKWHIVQPAAGDGTAADIAELRINTGQEANSTYDVTQMPPDATFLHANEHETGKANLAVWNHHAEDATVNVNCDSVLDDGNDWWLYNGFNPLAGAIASGTYATGEGIDVPMTAAVAGTPALPADFDGASAAVFAQQTLPTFGVFVLRRVGPSWVAPPLALAVD